MWILNRVSNDTKVYLLCDKPKYTVGRNKTCDIVAEPAQSSLGRQHATLIPHDDRVEVIDNESKYGTYINEQISSNVKITSNASVPLNDGDTIRFGYTDFVWRLEKIDIVVLASTLTDREKNNLRKDVTTLGGQFVDEWSDTCTHLVIKNLTLTIKVLQGLCHAIPIIRPEYFRTMLAAIRSKSTIPDVSAFQPADVDRIAIGSVSLQPNIDRKRLFGGKTFVFMNSKHMDTYKGIIECGMGECQSLDTKKLQRRSLVKQGVIVINYTGSSTQSQLASQTANELNDFLRSKGIRMVPESEISLAILHCSLDKFCNPNYKLRDNFESKLPAVPSNLLVDNTPITSDHSGSSSIVVPETVAQTLASTVPSNSDVINLMDDDDDVMLVECADLAMDVTNAGKRKISGEMDGPAIKKPNLSKNAATSESSTLAIPQRSTRSATKAKSFSTSNDSTGNRTKFTSTVQEDSLPVGISKAVPTTSSRAKRNLLSKATDQQSVSDRNIVGNSEKSSVDVAAQKSAKISLFVAAQKSTDNSAEISSNGSAQSFVNVAAQESDKISPKAKSSVNNSENFPLQISLIEGSQLRAGNRSQLPTSTQIETPKRKRIAHRPTNTSTFGGNVSDSDDDELFKFSNEPSLKKSRPTRASDSDSDDLQNYPQSSGPVAPAPSRPLTQLSQISSDAWLSRPTPSQTFTNATVRSKPTKRSKRIEQPKSSRASTGEWKIGQFCVSPTPIPIPTQGWYSKEVTMKADVDVKQEKSIGNGESKWIDSMKSGIEVITKKMNLVSTGGKVFKKQRFIVPTEIIKTSKVYEF